MRGLLCVSFVWVVACGDGVSRLDTEGHGTGGSGLSACDSSVTRLVDTCKIPSAQMVYDGTCDSYASCEASCLDGVDCRFFGYLSEQLSSSDALDERNTYLLCSRSCYADGPGSCVQAGIKARDCGVDLSSDFTASYGCSEVSTCVANCVMATPCDGLKGRSDVGLKFYTGCVNTCKNVRPSSNPFVSPGFGGTYGYCQLFPASMGCF